jgi:2-dehydropantoate 2-reductase
MEEAATVARANNVAIETNFPAQRLDFIDSLPAEAFASMAGDLARGNRLELEWLSGAVVRWGERFAVATPIHRAIEAGLVLHAGGRQLSG